MRNGRRQSIFALVSCAEAGIRISRRRKAQ